MVLAAGLCSVALGGNSSQLSGNGSSADGSKWWIRYRESGTSGENESFAAGSIDRQKGSATSSWPANTEQAQEPLVVSRCGYSFAEHATEHFNLMYRQKELPSRLVSRTADLLERAYRQFNSGFKQAGFTLGPMEERLAWIIFDDESQYRDFAEVSDGMRSSYLESYYSARSNQVVLMQASGFAGWRNSSPHRWNFASARFEESQVSGMDPQGDGLDALWDGGVLEVRRAVHEAAHQLAFNTGLQKRGVMYPLWVSEGLATNFECDRTSEIGVAGENAPRKRQLLRAYDGRRLMPLDSFATLVNIPPSGQHAANDLYAQAWGLFKFLFQNRPAGLKSYLTALAELDAGSRDRRTMELEFTSAFGSIQRLDRSWTRYLDSLQKHRR